MTDQDMAQIKPGEADQRPRIRRGEELDLLQKDPALRGIAVGVGWDLRKYEGDPPDLDASIFLLDKNDRTREDGDFVFYNNHSACGGAVQHRGDNRSGAGDGDDEIMHVSLNDIPFDVTRIVFVLSIYDLESAEREEEIDFSIARNVFFRVANQETGHEIFRYELDEDLDASGNSESALIIGALERIGPKWIFVAAGEPVEGGLAALATQYGIIVAENVQA